MTDRPDRDRDIEPDLDPQLLEFARRFDPARHLPDAPRVTAEQLRHRAEAREEDGVQGPWRPVWLPAVSVVAIVVLSVSGIAALRPYLNPAIVPDVNQTSSALHSPARVAGPARPAPLELAPAEGDTRLAKQVLTELAAKVAGQPARPAATFTYLRRQTWSAGSAGASTIIATDVQTWLRADLSGFEQSTTLPPQPSGDRTAQWTQQLPAETRANLQTYGPGAYPHPVLNPSPLAGILAAQIGNSYGYHVTTGVADLFRLDLSPAQRAAAIQVLAGTPHLAYHGKVTDRASRVGIAFISTDPGTSLREALIFDPETGELLDHERMGTGEGGELFVSAYTLYLDIHSTNTRP